MAKKKAKRKAGDGSEVLFSLVAVHRELKKARERLASKPKTPAAKKLAQDLKTAADLLDCGQNMAPNIA